MTRIAPQVFKWTGEAMVPLSMTKAKDQFEEGGRYRLAPVSEVSQQSRSFFFSVLTEAFKNLPEPLAERFTTVEALRKYALIRTGWHEPVQPAFYETPADAQQAAHQIQLAISKTRDPSSIVVQRDVTVTVLTARSQSGASMPKKEFEGFQQEFRPRIRVSDDWHHAEATRNERRSRPHREAPMPRRPMDWAEHDKERVRLLWESGAATTAIAAELNVSRNAILGTWYTATNGRGRRRLPKQIKTKRQPLPKGNRTRAWKPRRADEPEAPPTFVPMDDTPPLDSKPVGSPGCQWIYGEPHKGLDALRMCGRQKISGRSYCLEHCLRAYKSLKHEALSPEYFKENAA